MIFTDSFNFKGLSKVISMNDNYAFIIIDNQYDGVISINELSWLKKPPHPSKTLNQNQEIETKRRNPNPGIQTKESKPRNVNQGI